MSTRSRQRNEKKAKEALAEKRGFTATKREQSTRGSRKLVYAYCVVDANKVIQAQVPFISSKKTENESTKSLNRLGFDSPYVVSYEDICAIVSKVPRSEFSQDALNENTKKLGWLTKSATKHEGLVEFIMKEVATPVPLKLCTVFENEANVEKMLKRNYSKFSQLLKEIAGKVEFGITSYVSLDPDELLLRSTSKEVRSLQRKMEEASKGRAYFLKQELQDMLRSEFRSKALSSSRMIYEELKPFADRSTINSPLNTEAAGESGSSKKQRREMILNAAFLVGNVQLQEFQRRAEELKDEFGPKGISIRLSGPWPPYNFGQ